MFGLGWSEMVLVAIVALIVIGPKDLPGLFRTMGQMTGKARGMAREFSRAMEAAADDAGVKDISRSLKAAANPQKFGVDKLREATGMTHGPATQALSEERAAAKAKAGDAMAKAATARKEREAAAQAEAEAAPKAPAAKKPAAKKTAAKKPAAKKTAAKPKGDA
jgi:sec-independent protein translocase protein TatB|uniref:Sec-independent protein translocase protein TatB n=1 Tax=Yoonia sp. TaxID=2212373 RepID=UPI0040476253|tara:strand:+ start:565 stop:1056 length:492 start_codon:yes stop_codon:yes gene_type:complete